MARWNLKNNIPLSDYCDSIDYGYTESASSEKIGPKFLRITDIVKKTIEWNLVPYCKCSEENFEKFQLHEGDIVIARTGNTTGECNYISNPPKAVFASYLIRLKINDLCDSLFVYYFLKSKTYVDHIYSIVSEKSAQKNANAKTLTEVKTNFPSKEIQIKISKSLHDLTKKIQNLQNQNKILEQITQTTFQSWFVNFNGIAEFEDSELGKIPKGWKCKKISELIDEKILAKNQDGNHGEKHPKAADFVKSGIPFVMANNLENNSLDLDNCHHITKEQSDNLRIGFSISGDVLLTHKASIGRVDIVPELSEYIMLTPQVTYYRVLDEHVLSNIFLRYYFLSNYFQSQLLSICSQTTRDYVGILNQREFYILLPPVKNMKSFSQNITPMYKEIKINHNQIKILEKIRDVLLPKLMSGEIRL